jgi:hypothetical protein
MVKKTAVIILIFLLTWKAEAQYFRTGDDPASIRWRNIRTLHFQLIYPESFEGQAQRMAKVFEEVYNYGGKSLNFQPKPMPVLFHSYSTTSNGLVGWAPRRIEFFTTPHQSIYPQDWLEQLAIHEFRHTVQMGKITQSLPKIIPVLFGEQAGAFFTGLYLPFWFIEGDAVVTETALSQFGRGRSPSFLMEIQAQAVEKGLYSLEKAYLGSYRDYVPDYYQLGYYFVGETRRIFGSEIWENAIDNVGKKPISFNPFNKVIKKTTGFNQRQLYHFVFDSLRLKWLKDDKLYVESGSLISTPSKTYASYNPAFFLNDSTIVALKTSLNEVEHFVLISTSGREERLLVPGQIFEESVNMTDQLLVWSEEVPDLRWENGGKSVIHIFDTEKREDQILKPDFKASNPSVSPNHKHIAMVESDNANNYYIAIYDLESREVLKRFSTPDNNYFFSPRWINNDALVCVILTQSGKLLVQVDPFENELINLTDTSLGDIKQPVVEGNSVIFVSSFDGKNSLYKIGLSDKKIERIYHPRFGVENPAIHKGKILISDYTSNGYKLLDISSSIKKEPIESIKEAKFELADRLLSQEIAKPNFQVFDSINYFSKPYTKLQNLFHFHSWAPFYVDVESYKVQPGVTLMSQNILGTASTLLGYKWDSNEKSAFLTGKFTYTGRYPAFSVEMTSGNRAADYYSIRNHLNQNNGIIWSDTTKNRLRWKEIDIGLSAWIPLNLSRGRFSTYLQPEVRFNLLSRKSIGFQPDWFFSGVSKTIGYRVYFHHYLKKSYQDLVSNFGFVIDLSYKHKLAGPVETGNIAGIQIVNYLPGFAESHGFVLYNGFQVRNFGGDSYFSDAIKYPRGWGKFMQNKMYSFSLDYKFPIAFTDLSIGKLNYIKRIKADLYADFAIIEGDIYEHSEVTGLYSKNLSSFGIEVSAENNFFRFIIPIETGVRVGYIPEFRNLYFNFLYSINLPSF